MPERDGRRFVQWGRAVVAACIAAVMIPVALDAAGCGGNVVVGQGTGGTTSTGTDTSGSSSSGCLDPTAPGSPCPQFGPYPGTPCSSPGLCCDYGSCTFTPPMTCHNTQQYGQHTCMGGTWD